MNKVVVFADDRERDGSVVEALRRIPDLEVVVCRLDRGDYAVGELRRVVFERKTLRDFAQSVVDGPLFRQAYRLATTPCPSAFILEGRGSDLADVHVRREALQGAMVTLTIIFEIPVLRATDPDETVRLLLYSASQLHPAQTEALPRPGRRSRTRRRLQDLR
jgi:ERCC4-type nuclease